MFNSHIRGWINYYGRYYKSALYPTLRHIDRILARWAHRKFKSLRRHRRQTAHWIARVARFSRLLPRCEAEPGRPPCRNQPPDRRGDGSGIVRSAGGSQRTTRASFPCGYCIHRTPGRVYFAPRWRWRKPRNKLPQEGWPEITTPTPKPKEQPAWIRHTQEIFFYAINFTQ